MQEANLNETLSTLQEQLRAYLSARETFKTKILNATLGERKEACIALGMRRLVADEYVAQERTGVFAAFILSTLDTTKL